MKDVFTRLSLTLEKFQEYCFDGASCMSGCTNVVRALLKAKCPQWLYVCSCNNNLDLALQEVAKDMNLTTEALNVNQGVAVVIGKLHKQKTCLNCCMVFMGCKSLCPSHWCVRAPAISRVLAVYSILLVLAYYKMINLCEVKQESKQVGCTYKVNSRDLLHLVDRYILLCCEAIFIPCETVARNLRETDSTA